MPSAQAPQYQVKPAPWVKVQVAAAKAATLEAALAAARQAGGSVTAYLDDDTIHIIESRVENSGIPQGVFLKRHKLPKPGH